ncbi:hypothetical protein CALCODRAFT_519973, partial [Calocera cornea HHB12733]
MRLYADWTDALHSEPRNLRPGCAGIHGRYGHHVCPERVEAAHERGGQSPVRPTRQVSGRQDRPGGASTPSGRHISRIAGYPCTPDAADARGHDFVSAACSPERPRRPPCPHRPHRPGRSPPPRGTHGTPSAPRSSPARHPPPTPRPPRPPLARLTPRPPCPDCPGPASRSGQAQLHRAAVCPALRASCRPEQDQL